MNGTLRGPALIAAAAGRHMAQVGSGRMVFIGSVNGHYSEPESGVYSAAKAAIASLARSVVVDLASRGVIANTVSPGWVETPMTAEILPHATPEKIKEMIPIGRVGRPEELAKVIRFLVVDAPDYLCGANIVVDGGQTALAPSW
jgi:NAD(P)-dependent dehydrogenase (short-subunit alcohol dehydrogenase family)